MLYIVREPFDKWNLYYLMMKDKYIFCWMMEPFQPLAYDISSWLNARQVLWVPRDLDISIVCPYLIKSWIHTLEWRMKVHSANNIETNLPIKWKVLRNSLRLKRLLWRYSTVTSHLGRVLLYNEQRALLDQWKIACLAWDKITQTWTKGKVEEDKMYLD